MRIKVPRFDDYKLIEAKYPSTCRCGTHIAKGDTFAYADKTHLRCYQCYSHWAMEVAEELMREDAYITGGY